MTPFPVPENDAARVAALHAHQILDTPPEPAFDEIAQLAAELCGVPMALITFVDGQRQWFKSRVGVELAETSRESSFCAHAIVEPDRDIFEVPDAFDDPRFADNPLVTGGPHIRFYAGTPLIDEQGWALGTLCVLDRAPRKLTDSQRRSLAMLRRFVTTAFELRRLVARQQAAIRELEAAREALDAMRQTAEEATRAKGQYVAAMSHELRTPMNAVIGMTTLLQTTELDADQREYVDTIQSSGEVLLAVINDILDFSKLESGRVDIERTPMDLPGCVATTVHLVAAQARKKGLTLRVEPPAATPRWILADPVRVRQIILNLVSNAIKFTAQGGITVRFAARSGDGGKLEIEVVVTDTGIGISPDQLKRLFREFGQADVSTTRHYGGTGLGLVISKRLAELHGGRMWVESTPGVGSEFHFTLLAEETAAPATLPAAIETGGLTRDFARRYPATILLAEDNAVNQRVATRLLDKLGYATTVASNGHEALAALRARPFDVVLMDVEMPELDGIDATRKLRAELPAAAQPFVIALTAHAFMDQRERFFAAGMNSYLAKPIRVSELTTALARAVTERQARRQADGG